MKSLIQYIEIMLALVLLLNFSSADDLSVLKDLFDKSNSHGEMIKTIRMDTTIIQKTDRKHPLKRQFSI